MKDPSGNNKIRVVIIGDSLIFRNGLRMLIAAQKNLEVAGEVADLAEALRVLGSVKADVALVCSDELENIDSDAFFSEFSNDFATLVLTRANDPKIHRKYVISGINGVITKEQRSVVLFKAIERVHAGDLWFRRDVMKQTIDQLVREKNAGPSANESDLYASLTQREKEVLASICSGMKNKAIAESLFITETTVRHHLTSIFEKLNVKSRLSLAILAFNGGFAEVPKLPNKMGDDPVKENIRDSQAMHPGHNGRRLKR